MFSFWKIYNFKDPPPPSADGIPKSNAQSTYIPIEYHSVCSPVGIGTSHIPSPASESVLPPESKGGGGAGPAGEGVGESQLGRLEKKLSTLSTLWPNVSTLLAFLLL